jgi:hypothetical protein
MINLKNIFYLLYSLFLVCASANSAEFSPNVMAPTDIKTEQEWKSFEEQIDGLKELGVNSIATQIWWGKVEKNDNQFDWSYYVRLSNLIRSKGLNWIPHLSFHSCSKLTQIDCNISMPFWIWTKYEDNLKYVGESGEFSTEAVSVWATETILTEYKDFIISFKDRFQEHSQNVQEIILGIGPKGELRFPSINSVNEIGQNQAHSLLAKKSFRSFIKDKYKTIDNVNSIWAKEYLNFEEIDPLKTSEFNVQEQRSKDFYHWYNKSLTDHAEILITTASRILVSEDSNFNHIELGIKIPNIHWSREAELNAGLIRIDENFLSENLSLSYSHVLESISNSKTLTSNDSIFFNFTGLEKSNREGVSRAKDLVIQISQLALEKSIKIKGENSTTNKFGSNETWDNMWSAVQNNQYSGLTLYRIQDISKNPLAFDFLKWIIDNMKN